MSAVDDLCRSYLDVRWQADPAAASAAGLASHDGRLGAFDADSVREHLAALRALAAACEELEVDDLQDEIDRTALLDDIRVRMFRFEHEQPHRRNPAFWTSHLFEGCHALLARRTDPATVAQGVLDRLKAVPAFLDAGRGTLSRPPRVFVDAALQMLGGGGELLVALARRAGEAAPGLRTPLEAATAEALVALRDFGRALGGSVAADDDPMAFAVGETQFNRRLRHEHALLAGAPELWRYGLHLRDEVERQLAEHARRLDPHRHWRDVVERVREARAPDASAVLAAYADLVADAREFCAAQDLVTVPPNLPLHVEATPAFLRPVLPFAAYEPPPTYRPEDGGRFYVTEPDPAADAVSAARQLRTHALPGLESLVAHEAWPGHHLQIGTAQGLAREVRRHVWSPLTVEGWALYCEDLLEEQGFYRDDEAILLRLVNLLWRAVRIDLDIGLHTRGLTPGAAVEELVARLPMERASAEAEVRRYCQMPTYQLCYAVGRRELRDLRDAIRAREGRDFSLRGFHDAVLAYGGLPVPLVRWGMGVE